MRVTQGKPYPLGATWDGLGVNFALFSEHATKVELCLFEKVSSKKEFIRIELQERNGYVWHAYIRDVRPGQLYGYRVYGPYDPENGHRFNPNKLLVDPYAKCVARRVHWDDNLFGYEIGHEDEDLSFDERDSAATAPLGAVVDQAFSWGEDKRPDIPWNKTIIYEAHIKGLTKLLPGIPEHMRGTYAAISSEPVIDHLKSLGITALELLPVHHRVNNRRLIDMGLSDYWGYNTLSFFAPDDRFASSEGMLDHLQEFKVMVRALHAAGIEVILDVVYNHTVEGSHLGPTLSFRGIDNKAYYRSNPEDPRFYMDYTGCGNTLNMMHPRVIQLIMDSLRYWIQEMHVDGFRFDLASALARELFDVDNLSGFFDVIQQDPVISQVKLIAEPWDLGAGGYQVGNFPVLWTEWNGKYRDAVRRFIKGDAGLLGEMGYRLTGSSDLYEHSGRKPFASINFVTCHDGFTLQDLVSYNEKHNIDNGEENRDGESHNNSWNCGVEGQTADREITKLRYRQKRNFMATLFFSVGVPMLSGGDELGRTQRGNNNAYCQDNEISWYDWNLTKEDADFLDFVKRVIAIRKQQLVIHRIDFFKGSTAETAAHDIVWIGTNGLPMEQKDWNDPSHKVLGLLFEKDGIREYDERTGEERFGRTLLMLCNSSHIDIPFTLPTTFLPDERGGKWKILVDTAAPFFDVEATSARYDLKSRSLALLELIEVAVPQPPMPPPAVITPKKRARSLKSKE
jgi:glycogen operon protein